MRFAVVAMTIVEYLFPSQSFCPKLPHKIFVNFVNNAFYKICAQFHCSNDNCQFLKCKAGSTKKIDFVDKFCCQKPYFVAQKKRFIGAMIPNNRLTVRKELGKNIKDSVFNF